MLHLGAAQLKASPAPDHGPAHGQAFPQPDQVYPSQTRLPNIIAYWGGVGGGAGPQKKGETYPTIARAQQSAVAKRGCEQLESPRTKNNKKNN